MTKMLTKAKRKLPLTLNKLKALPSSPRSRPLKRLSRRQLRKTPSRLKPRLRPKRQLRPKQLPPWLH